MKEIRTESHLKLNNEMLLHLRRVLRLDYVLSTWYTSVKLFKCSIQIHSIVGNNSEKETESLTRDVYNFLKNVLRPESGTMRLD